MRVIKTVNELRQALKLLKNNAKKVAFVPTMGALHEGHLSLLKLAQNIADITVSSIFVNPKQFGPSEDFSAYPRKEKEDLQELADHKIDIVYMPDVEEMYGNGFATSLSVAGVSEGLCGSKRPGHFDGVALIVTKLLLQVMPEIAIFGEKDYQQLQVIKRLVVDLNIPVEIISAPTCREPDGLAMSSRNLYLNAEERQIAPLLYRTLKDAAAAITSGASVETVINAAIAQLLKEGFAHVDYFELRDAETLKTVSYPDSPARLLAAAYLGKCRLIDNVALS